MIGKDRQQHSWVRRAWRSFTDACSFLFSSSTGAISSNFHRRYSDTFITFYKSKGSKTTFHKQHKTRLLWAYLNSADHCRQVSSHPHRLHARLSLLQHVKVVATPDNSAEELGWLSRFLNNFFNITNSYPWRRPPRPLPCSDGTSEPRPGHRRCHRRRLLSSCWRILHCATWRIPHALHPRSGKISQ